jgi:hypothetical protein
MTVVYAIYLYLNVSVLMCISVHILRFSERHPLYHYDTKLQILFPRERIYYRLHLIKFQWRSDKTDDCKPFKYGSIFSEMGRTLRKLEWVNGTTVSQSCAPLLLPFLFCFMFIELITKLATCLCYDGLHNILCYSTFSFIIFLGWWRFINSLHQWLFNHYWTLNTDIH